MQTSLSQMNLIQDTPVSLKTAISILRANVTDSKTHVDALQLPWNNCWKKTDCKYMSDLLIVKYPKLTKKMQIRDILIELAQNDKVIFRHVYLDTF